VYCNVDQWIEIRRRVLNHEISKRQACEEYELHWQTLKKILSQPVPPERREPGPPRPSKLDPFRPAIQAMLDSDRQSHRKQRHTAWRIFERLRDEHGYEGRYTLVKDAVRELKLSRKEVFLPLKHDPGEAQVDFGYCYVNLAGQRQQVAMFVLSLPYSDAVYCQVFPRECSEVFLEGHVRAFRFFAGVPRRISYDNTKVAVAKIVGDREREQTKEFQRLVGHFLFEPHFCLVRRPNEKGHVERLLDYARHRCLVPIPTVNTLEELNQYLEAWCRKDLEQTARKQSVPKQLRLCDDQGAFLPSPEQDFEARCVAPGQADSLSLVTFDRNQYSVPTQYAHRKVTIVAGIEDVRIIFEDRLIAQHRRCWDRDQTFFEPIHYLALLERKPGGFDFAKPLAGWELPVSFGILRRQLEADLDSRGTREFIKVLRLLERHTLSALKAAVETALELGTTSADAVRLIVDASQEPPIGLFSLEGRPHLKLVRVESANVAAYQSLLTTSVLTEVSP
jgi:transposase